MSTSQGGGRHRWSRWILESYVGVKGIWRSWRGSLPLFLLLLLMMLLFLLRVLLKRMSRSRHPAVWNRSYSCVPHRLSVIVQVPPDVSLSPWCVPPGCRVVESEPPLKDGWLFWRADSAMAGRSLLHSRRRWRRKGTGRFGICALRRCARSCSLPATMGSLGWWWVWEEKNWPSVQVRKVRLLGCGQALVARIRASRGGALN